MKIHQLIVPLLVVLSGCYTVKQKTLVSKGRFPSSETKVEGVYYVAKQIDKPGLDNPYGTYVMAKASKYRYETTERYELQKDFDPKSYIISGILFSGLGGGIFALNPGLIAERTTPAQAYFSGVAICAGLWVLAGTYFTKDKVTRHIDVKGFEYDYKPEQLMPNTGINVTANGKIKTFQTDEKGLLRFSPHYDFDFKEFKTNDPIAFHFRQGQTNFVGPVVLTPSDWMGQYARIKVPKTPIINNLDGILGYAREGMLYKILDLNTDMINIQAGSKSAYIPLKDADVLYTTETKSDLSPAIKGYVVDEMQKWLQQGEFELPEDYLKRIAKKDEQLLVFTNEAMKTFQKEYVEMFDWKNASISNYDPNSQTFKIQVPALSEIVLHVPIQNAREFKNNWRTAVFKNQEFTLVDGKWELVSLQVEDQNQGFVANYHSKLSYNYDPVNQFAFDFKDFEPDLSKISANKPEIPVNQGGNSESYSINTNLPKSLMAQPDAIAVVIGNALYQKTENVNYALNDAQLMKLYLTQVFGFSEGNIIFVMNAGKAEFEGLFGTESNHKGRLFNYIKPDVSDVFIFYSGHGAPDPNTAEAYIVPSDCDPSYLNLQGYALKTLYGNLAKLPAKSTTVVLDACFSGAGVLRNISSVRIKPKDNEENIPNSVILTSSSGDQVSSWYAEKRHGLFTYFFLKAIHNYKQTDKNNDNQLSFNELFDYISDKTNGIPYYARRLNAVEQNPVMRGSNTDKVFIKF
jgi:hypothetical protein